jgi:hypothetical protein
MLWRMQDYAGARVNSLIVNGTVVAIVIAAIVGVVADLLFEPAMDDSFVRTVVPPVPGIVSVAEIVQLRFIVLPQQIRVAENPDPNLVERPQTVADTVGWLSASFSLAIAIYGVVLAIMVGGWWWPLGFGAAALVAFAIFVSYANGRLGAISIEARSRGLA